MIKKFLLTAGIALSLLSISKVAKAGDLYAGSAGGPDVYTVVYTTYTLSAISTTSIVISLSSQTSDGLNIWPHPLTARSLIIDTAQIEVDKAAATTASVKLGVVREVNASSGTIVWFDTCNSTINVSNTNAFQHVEYTQGGLNTRVNSVAQTGGPNTGTLPWVFSNDLTSAFTLYTSSTGTSFPSVVSQSAIYRMQVGDVAALMTTSGAANVAIQLRYHVENQ